MATNPNQTLEDLTAPPPYLPTSAEIEQRLARPRSCASAPSMPRSTPAKWSASPTSKQPTQYGPTATEAPSAPSAWLPGTPSPTAFARLSKPPQTASQGVRTVVSSMATSIANASMLRSNNLPPSAHSPPTQSKRAVDALPSVSSCNNSKPRTHERKTNNQPSRSFLAYLAFRSIFFQHENAGRGGLSLFSLTKCILLRKALWSHERDGQIRGPYLLRAQGFAGGCP
jgi:hypothetical protein